MYEAQHRTALVAEHDPATDDISFSILEVAGIFHSEYLLREGSDLRTIEEVDNPATNRALRLLWQGESVTETHRQELETKLLCRAD